ncbi:hypothetical protein BST63_03710 [Bradyrhizobium canariense]|uniref:Uncharacterized protein n=1 Tax=Bradyrhizobium canariense TaxID=255045 RepID=A0ABX3XA39_9BRAD|nr:hypothetical protein BSR47_04150 [Bradyrhizobium canariense]OSJ34376.1 hypothetical protein BST63_03710 [Bradyrhizobium canariense]
MMLGQLDTARPTQESVRTPSFLSDGGLKNDLSMNVADSRMAAGDWIDVAEDASSEFDPRRSGERASGGQKSFDAVPPMPASPEYGLVAGE